MSEQKRRWCPIVGLTLEAGTYDVRWHPEWERQRQSNDPNLQDPVAAQQVGEIYLERSTTFGYGDGEEQTVIVMYEADHSTHDDGLRGGAIDGLEVDLDSRRN